MTGKKKGRSIYIGWNVCVLIHILFGPDWRYFCDGNYELLLLSAQDCNQNTSNGQIWSSSPLFVLQADCSSRYVIQNERFRTWPLVRCLFLISVNMYYCFRNSVRSWSMYYTPKCYGKEHNFCCRIRPVHAYIHLSVVCVLLLLLLPLSSFHVWELVQIKTFELGGHASFPPHPPMFLFKIKNYPIWAYP